MASNSPVHVLKSTAGIGSMKRLIVTVNIVVGPADRTHQTDNAVIFATCSGGITTVITNQPRPPIAQALSLELLAPQ